MKNLKLKGLIIASIIATASHPWGTNDIAVSIQNTSSTTTQTGTHSQRLPLINASAFDKEEEELMYIINSQSNNGTTQIEMHSQPIPMINLIPIKQVKKEKLIRIVSSLIALPLKLKLNNQGIQDIIEASSVLETANHPDASPQTKRIAADKLISLGFLKEAKKIFQEID